MAAKFKNPVPVTAVFDIGKTNKKFLLFDSSFEVIHQVQATIPPAKDDEGDTCEDLNGLTRWMKAVFSRTQADERFRIERINFSAYGASLVHLDDQGEIVAPLYDYFKSYPEKLLQEFYDRYGGKENFSLITASPAMGMLNSGLQLYWLKHAKPDIFAKIATSLHFPQFAGFLFTRHACAELTSIGCHTGLWNFRKGTYHEWVRREGVDRLFPPIVPTRRQKMITCEGQEILAGAGVHDSSASLVPYLRTFNDPFLLVSTGTWSIVFNPFCKSALKYDELNRDCLHYIDVRGNQVKAARFLLGREYDHQNEKLKKQFGISPDEREISLNLSILEELIGNAGPNRLKLETVGGSGPWPQESPEEWKPDSFASYEEAFHQLMLDLASIQADSIRLTMGETDIRNIIVTGGFGNNGIFMRLLASKFPDKSVFAADLSEATSLGAALLVNDEARPAIHLKRYAPVRSRLLRDYQWRPQSG